VSRWILGTLLLAGVAISFSNVVARYLFGYAIFWAEEVLVFLMIWGVFIGAAAAAYDGAHLNMDLFSSNFAGRLRAALDSAILALWLACCAFMIYQSAQVVQLFYQGGVVSVAAGVPKWLPHAAIPAGFALMALALLLRKKA
jgi:TRAP-type C4-dicarboxylate transport system permease small subunit